MTLSASTFVEPARGITFALPEEDIPPGLKSRILHALESVPWNLYVNRELDNEREVLARLFGVSPTSLTFTHGADDAVRRVALGLRPEIVLYPQSGYPGYLRAAALAGSAHRSYAPHASSSDLRNQIHNSVAGVKSLIYICWPGNPVGNIDQLVSLQGISKIANHVVVDLTYLNPVSSDFARLMRLCLDQRASVIFSFSKAIGLAGSRLGGIVTPRDSDVTLAPAEHFPWTIFQAAVLSAILTDQGIAEVCDSFARQESLRDRVVAQAKRAGVGGLTFDASTFITAPTNQITSQTTAEAHEARLLKRYDDLGVSRFDVRLQTLDLFDRAAQARQQFATR